MPVGPPSVQPPTRAELRQDVINLADAYGSPRWDASIGGEVDRRLGMIHRQEWTKILNSAPYYTMTQLTPTTDGNGVIPVASLSTGSGDAFQQFYRIIAVYVNNFRYEYVDARKWVQTAIMPIQDFVWFWTGASITLPNAKNVTLTGLWVNWTPQRFDLLATDLSVVQLPPDYDDIFTNEGAAALLMKGATQSAAAAELRAYAEQKRADRLADLARISIDPTKVEYDDSTMNWGGQIILPLPLLIHSGHAFSSLSLSVIAALSVIGAFAAHAATRVIRAILRRKRVAA